MPVPLKPNDVVPPAGSVRFQSTLRTATLGGCCTSVPFHGAPSKPCPPEYDQRTVHPFNAVGPLLRMFTWAWKCPAQFTGRFCQVAVQPLGPPLGLVVGLVVGLVLGLGLGLVLLDGVGDGDPELPPGPTPVTSPCPPSKTTSEQLKKFSWLSERTHWMKMMCRPVLPAGNVMSHE